MEITEAVAEAPATLLAPVRESRPFFWFTIGQSVSCFGDKLHSMALIGLIGATQPQSTALVISGFAVLYCVPFLFVTPFAGMIVDRVDRKWMLIACDAARAVLVALMPLAAASGRLVPLFALVAAVFVLTLFFDVAKMAIIPDLVPSQDLLGANAISSLTGRVATLAGIVLGGMIVGWRFWNRFGAPGYAAGFYLDSLTFLISVVTLLALNRRPPGHTIHGDRPARLREPRGARSAGAPEPWPTPLSDLREVLRVAHDDPRVVLVLASTGLLGVVGGCMYVVIIVVLQTRTAWGTPGVGFTVGIMACGIVVASALVGRFGGGWRRERMILGGFAAMAALIIASARPFAFLLHGPLSFAAGLALGPVMIAQDTLLHERVPERVRGRVFSARDVILNVTFGLSAATTGIIVTALSRYGIGDPFRPTLLGAGFLVFVAAARGNTFVRRGVR